MPAEKVMYLKPTNYCNVGCDHCYLSTDVRKNKLKMTESQLVNAANLLKSAVQQEGASSAHIIWHGGEPMVLSPAFYKSTEHVLKEVLAQIPYTESMQTSLIPFSEDWIDLIHQRFDSHLGSSIDFSQRKIQGSPDRYMELWLGKVALARRHGIHITPGMVPSRSDINQADAIIDFFCDNDFSRFNIDRYSDYGVKMVDRPTNKQHAGFMCDLFDAIISRKQKNKRVPLINVIYAGIRGVLFSQPGDRWGTTCQRDFIVVEPDGSINTCPDRTSYDTPFSNVNDGFDMFAGSPKRRQWIRIATVEHQESHCHQCEFNHWCKSGCPITPNGPANGEQECSGYKSFLLHIKDRLKHSDVRAICLQYVGD